MTLQDKQPVSLAEELRKLAAYWRSREFDEACMGDERDTEFICAEQVEKLLAQHAQPEQVRCGVIGNLEAGQKTCELPKGHEGYHTQGSVHWLGYFAQPEVPVGLTKEQATKLALLIVARCSVVATKEQELGASDVGFEVQQVKYEIPILLNSLFADRLNALLDAPAHAAEQSRLTEDGTYWIAFGKFLTARFGGELPADNEHGRFWEAASNLLAQHAVAEPQTLGQRMGNGAPAVLLQKIEAILGRCVFDQPDSLTYDEGVKLVRELVAPAHAAEQPKLTAAQVQEAQEAWELSPDGSGRKFEFISKYLNALLTSPAAPPPYGRAGGNYCSICNIYNHWCEHIQPPLAPGEQPPRFTLTGTYRPATGEFVPPAQEGAREPLTFEQWFDLWDTTHDPEVKRLCGIAWGAAQPSPQTKEDGK